jgi:hypothetical protein
MENGCIAPDRFAAIRRSRVHGDPRKYRNYTGSKNKHKGPWRKLETLSRPPSSSSSRSKNSGVAQWWRLRGSTTWRWSTMWTRPTEQSSGGVAVLKISTKDPRENLKRDQDLRPLPPPDRRTLASHCDGASGEAPLGDGAQCEPDQRSRAAAERQSYCHWVWHDDGMKPPIIAGEELLLRTRRRSLKCTLQDTTMDARASRRGSPPRHGQHQQPDDEEEDGEAARTPSPPRPVGKRSKHADPLYAILPFHHGRPRRAQKQQIPRQSLAPRRFIKGASPLEDLRLESTIDPSRGQLGRTHWCRAGAPGGQ